MNEGHSLGKVLGNIPGGHIRDAGSTVSPSRCRSHFHGVARCLRSSVCSSSVTRATMSIAMTIMHCGTGVHELWNFSTSEILSSFPGFWDPPTHHHQQSLAFLHPSAPHGAVAPNCVSGMALLYSGAISAVRILHRGLPQ